ncbi:hypothetical protein HZ326_0595 [Fusarium oxysporum f. sp. albedinis]|nr:hypothetical protein HZ326_0595 [Fusarium oxysporum f. sp. albedinis]
MNINIGHGLLRDNRSGHMKPQAQGQVCVCMWRRKWIKGPIPRFCDACHRQKFPVQSHPTLHAYLSLGGWSLKGLN